MMVAVDNAITGLVMDDGKAYILALVYILVLPWQISLFAGFTGAIRTVADSTVFCGYMNIGTIPLLGKQAEFKVNVTANN